MSLAKNERAAVMKKHGRTASDTGSPEVQIALLTAEINGLSDHFKTHVKDSHSRQGLIRKVNLRRKLMKYLQRQDVALYQKLIEELNIRG